LIPPRDVAKTIATPPITATTPKMGGMGIVFVASAVASMEPGEAVGRIEALEPPQKEQDE